MLRESSETWKRKYQIAKAEARKKIGSKLSKDLTDTDKTELLKLQAIREDLVIDKIEDIEKVK